MKIFIKLYFNYIFLSNILTINKKVYFQIYKMLILVNVICLFLLNGGKYYLKIDYYFL